MSANVRPAGWNNWNDPAKEKTARYAEYASTGPGGDLSGRMEWGKHLTAAEAATYSIENVLGGEDGWDPRKGTVRKEAKTAKEQRPALAPLASGDVLLAVAASEDSRFAVSTDGYKWTVTKAAAPIGAFVMRGPDRTFHAVWSSGTRGDKSLMHASSKDLMEWNSPQRIEVMAKQDALDVVSPRLYWDGTRFLITWGSTMAVNSIQSFQEEVDNNPRIFYAATQDFETFTEPALLFDPNYSVKDAVMLPMGAGFALLHNDNTTPVHALRVAPGRVRLVRGGRRGMRSRRNSSNSRRRSGWARSGGFTRRIRRPVNGSRKDSRFLDVYGRRSGDGGRRAAPRPA